jgi:hypothetical protein
MNRRQDMASTDRPHRQPDYRLEEIDGELLLFHPGKAQILYCNETASLVWQLCDGKQTVAEIIALLAEAFPEAADSIPDDVEAVLKQFAKHDAVEFV